MRKHVHHGVLESKWTPRAQSAEQSSKFSHFKKLEWENFGHFLLEKWPKCLYDCQIHSSIHEQGPSTMLPEGKDCDWSVNSCTSLVEEDVGERNGGCRVTKVKEEGERFSEGIYRGWRKRHGCGVVVLVSSPISIFHCWRLFIFQSNFINVGTRVGVLK